MLNVLLLIWGIFAFVYIFLIDYLPAVMLFKLIPMFIAIIIALSTKPSSQKRYFLLIIIGLVFCTFGDYSLQWFLIGLSSFLIGHLFYIAAFSTTHIQKTPSLVKILLLLYGITMIIWVAGTLFSKGETVLAIAVCFYILVILSMGWTSWWTGSRFAIIGAILFIISDSYLAINRFLYDLPLSHEIIMLTYYGAQILLALSISKYSELRNKMIQ